MIQIFFIVFKWFVTVVFRYIFQIVYCYISSKSWTIMSQHNLACTSYIFVFMFLISSAISYQCIKNSPCSCVYEDGREISLHKLPQQTLQATIINITYIFHPCSNIAPNLPKVPENETIQNECKNTTVCIIICYVFPRQCFSKILQLF